ncbi:cbb3-type cytochrome oxidase subunit 3 [Marilutibacter alkalisoli]|uniref:Cbb3-type cytochrome c oxidase subunit 3 n=1 Tax=Marilutibacter alkalisoli TaxID=2591633 RepID=A0A514BR07_9GAMM|nr:cbb3-type cytochrome c oxidase subunit 3 [Lysobacter alkalisoli]QDH69832.1 cbb3-type cytochrome c oxidase subunit 3 [Lysobacter alkalisoli]
MISGIVSVLLLALFAAGWLWAWSPKRRQDFEAAALLPLEQDEPALADSVLPPEMKP